MNIFKALMGEKRRIKVERDHCTDGNLERVQEYMKHPLNWKL
jgi:hypothetical protein